MRIIVNDWSEVVEITGLSASIDYFNKKNIPSHKEVYKEPYEGKWYYQKGIDVSYREVGSDHKDKDFGYRPESHYRSCCFHKDPEKVTLETLFKIGGQINKDALEKGFVNLQDPQGLFEKAIKNSLEYYGRYYQDIYEFMRKKNKSE